VFHKLRQVAPKRAMGQNGFAIGTIDEQMKPMDRLRCIERHINAAGFEHAQNRDDRRR